MLLRSSPRKRRSSLGSALSGRRAPDQKALFNDADNGVDDDDKGRKHKHAGENPRHVEYALRLLDQIAEAGSATTAPTTAKPTEVCNDENIHDNADGQ